MSEFDTKLSELTARVERLEQELGSGPAVRKTHYSVAEFANLVGRSPYTVREWARLGRVRATRQGTGCGPYQAFAISAGRELRVIVNSDKTTDEHAATICHDIAKAFETELTYPGEIKVTVVREARFTETAK